MISISASFSAAMTSTTAEPRLLLVASLRNQVGQDGVTATASSSFDADFPVSGIYDGDASHINAGSASAADDGIGHSMWKSGNAGTGSAYTLRGDWNNNSSSSIAILGEDVDASEAHVGVGFGSTYYNQDFDDLTTGSLAGQGGYTITAGTTTAIIAMTTSAAFNGTRYGVILRGEPDGASSWREADRQTTTALSTTALISWMWNMTDAGDNSASSEVILAASGTPTFKVRMLGDKSIQFWTGTAYRTVRGAEYVTTSTWGAFSIQLAPGTITSHTAFSLWHDGRELADGYCDMTGVNGLRLRVDATVATAQFYLDDLRQGSAFANSGILEFDIDQGATPSSDNMTIAFSATSYAISRIPGDSWRHPIWNNGAARTFGNTTTNEYVAQTFTPTSTSIINEVTFALLATGSSAVDAAASVWVEIHPVTSGSIASLSVLPIAVSSGIGWTSIATGTDDARRVAFTFDQMPTLNSGTSYAFVLCSSIPMTSTAYAQVREDAGAGFGGGQSLQFDGAGWTAPGTDLGFEVRRTHQTETGWAFTNQDTALSLRISSTQAAFMQSFQVPYAITASGFQVMLRRKNNATFTSSDSWRASLYTDSGSTPSTLVASSADISPRILPEGSGVVVATGGNVTVVGAYTIHIFTANGTFSVTTGGDVELLVVGGGGGGGGNIGGGGGAGGFRYTTTIAITAQDYSITTGLGGAGDVTTNGTAVGAQGQHSIGLGLTATGGGGGRSFNSVAPSIGGSGGGGSGDSDAGIAGIAGEGNAGGGGTTTAGNYGAGGGGGAGAAGSNATPTVAGDGGAGTASSVTGFSVTYAGGGGGGGYQTPGVTAGSGGVGGGGAGAANINGDGVAGTANTGGGGGGGAGGGTGFGGNGGSGIVVIRYLTPIPGAWAQQSAWFASTTTLLPSTTYYLGITGNWTLSETNTLEIAADGTGSYGQGRSWVGTDPTIGSNPAWSVRGAGEDLCFNITGPEKPWVRFDAAFSTAAHSATPAYYVATDNPERTVSSSGITFTVAPIARFARVRVEMVAKPTAAAVAPHSVILHGFGFNYTYFTPQSVEIDFG